jgi:hypothetical protein
MRVLPLLLIGGFLGIASAGEAAPAADQGAETPPTPASSVSAATKNDGKADAQQAGRFDPCALLTKEEVSEVQGSPVTGTKNSERSAQGVSTTQCFYSTAEFNRSINLTVTRRDPAADGNRSARDVWRESFGRFSNPDAEAEEEHKEPKAGRRSEEEREKEAKPPTRVEGLGEEAFWTSGIGSTLYVLKGEQFLRISIGGPEKDEGKLEHAKRLAAKALERL